MSHEDKKKEVNIIVNGRLVPVEKEKLSYRDIVSIDSGSPYVENPNIVYTVTYSRGKDDKIHDLIDGGKEVEAHEGMVFNVTKTDKS